MLRSRTFTIKSRYIHYLAAGRGGTLNVVVDGFEKIRDPIYGGLTTAVDVGDRFRWITQDVGMWIGQTAFLELADGAVPDYHGATTRIADGRGYLAVDEIRMSDRPAPAVAGRRGRLKGRSTWMRSTRRSAPRGPSCPAGSATRIERFRAAEASIPEPRLALAIADGSGMDEHVHIRGNYKSPGDRVRRRFLEVLGGRSMSTPGAAAGGWSWPVASSTRAPTP